MTNLVAMLTHGGRGGEVLLEDGSHTLNAELGGIATRRRAVLPRHTRAGAARWTSTCCARRSAPDDAQPDGHRARLDGEHAQPLRRLGAAARLHGGGLEPRAREGRAGAPRRRAHLQRGDRAQGEARARWRSTPIRSASASRRACPRRSARYCAGAAISSSGRAPSGAWWAATCARPGPLAAAGIVALETMVDRLAEDHANAKRLAEGLNRIDASLVDPQRCRFQSRASGSEEERAPRRAVVGGPEAERRGWWRRATPTRCASSPTGTSRPRTWMLTVAAFAEPVAIG